ncbi:MAG: hypothetical protein WC781_00255 [Candidatus Pacearchaeota archaeon]|jgi:hypothetical protein
MKKEGGKGKLILGIIILIVLVLAVFFTFIYTPKCKDVSCWESKLKSCSKASYMNDAKDITWQYKILGKSGNKCQVYVKALEVKQGLTSAMILQGKDMKCLLPYGIIASPESNPNLCNGILKEEMQTLIIQKLHQYILQNIGTISQELLGIEEIAENETAHNFTA